MDENAVVASVCKRLEALGCTITQRCTTTEHGIDVVAHDSENGARYLVEAKGGTSSRESSTRFGSPYTQSQVFDRVAKGVFTCLQLRAEYPNRKQEHIVLAVSDGNWFRKYLAPVLEQLQAAGIEVWIESNP